MLSLSHQKTTSQTFDVLSELDETNPYLSEKDKISKEAEKVDDYEDLELVDVQGGIFGHGRDDPHTISSGEVGDEARYRLRGYCFTALNHFIDIKKGSGYFDDYDGYSYYRGSGSKDEFQNANEIADSLLTQLLAGVTDKKVDEGLNWSLNDEYVHVPGNPWYIGCSPAVERYSYFQDKRQYSNKEDELLARFPLAASTGQTGKGIPYSIFMPLDNMARYWYEVFINYREPIYLNRCIHPVGPVMHAIQDASIPHHTAGCIGNWHSKYETDLESYLDSWFADSAFNEGVKELYKQWNRVDLNPPNHLNISDWDKLPAINWRIDHLVTWIALNAFREYDQTYNHFRNGYQFDHHSAKRLTQMAISMGMLVLQKIRQKVYESWIKTSTYAERVKLYNGGVIGIFSNETDPPDEYRYANDEKVVNGVWEGYEYGTHECWLKEKTAAFHVKRYRSGIIGVFHTQAAADLEKELASGRSWSKNSPYR